MHALSYLMYANLALWLGLFLYGGGLYLRQARLERELILLKDLCRSRGLETGPDNEPGA